MRIALGSNEAPTIGFPNVGQPDVRVNSVDGATGIATVQLAVSAAGCDLAITARPVENSSCRETSWACLPDENPPDRSLGGRSDNLLVAAKRPPGHLMATDRVFSDEELRIAGLRSIDALAEALAAGDADADAALVFTARLRAEVLSMLANYDGWEAALQGEIARLDGEDSLRGALREIEDPSVAPERGELDHDAGTRWRDMIREIRRRLESGDGERALEMARALHEEALAHHDRGTSRTTALLSWIGRNHGADAVGQALDGAMASDLLGDASFRERAEALMHFTRVHLQSFKLEEDEEKLTFLCPVCPSGGRLLREGHYDAPRSGLHAAGPSPLTWNRDSLPVYCCHEPVMEKASIEATGIPLFVVDASARLGVDPCPTYLYKDPADIPERFFTRLGLEKPKR